MLGKAMPTSPVLARALDRTLAPVSAARPAVPVGMPRLGRSVARRPIAVGAESKEMDFDAFLTEVATKWDKTENKAVVGGYVVGTAVVILLAEYLMHLPVLNVLLGFPVQLLGLLCLPWLGVRWFLEGRSALDDVDEAATNLYQRLPGWKSD